MADNIVDAAAASEGSYVNDLFLNEVYEFTNFIIVPLRHDLDLDLDSSRIQLDTLGHTLTPSVSVKSCHLCFLPSEPHFL